MGTASLILGICSVIIGMIPFCGTIAFLPAIIGLILGIIDFINKKQLNQPKTKALVGIILSTIAITLIIFWLFLVAVTTSSEDFDNTLNKIQTEQTTNTQSNEY